jgi:hypothetical protein
LMRVTQGKASGTDSTPSNEARRRPGLVCGSNGRVPGIFAPRPSADSPTRTTGRVTARYYAT